MNGQMTCYPCASGKADDAKSQAQAN